MTTLAGTAERMGSGTHAGGNRARFYGLLIAATALPYLLFPVCLYLLPGGVGTIGTLQTCLFFGAGGHVAASFFFYDDPRVRAFMRDGRWMRYAVVPVAILLVAGVAFALGTRTVRAYAIVGFWIWQVHHFTRQNHGILAFVSRADRIPVTTAERTAITLTDIAAVLATLCLVTPFRTTVLADWGWHLYAVAAGVYAAAWAIYLGSRPARGLRSVPLRTLMVLFLMAFYAPLFLFDDAFPAVYMYLAAHGLQYLVFMSFVAGRPHGGRLRRIGALVAFTLVGGAVIKLMQTPDVWGPYRDTLMGLSLGVVMWHFVLDAGVWRLSEPFQRGYMAERFDFLA